MATNNNNKQTFCSAVCPWAIARAKEKSTWRGLGVLAAATGIFGAPEQAHVIIGGLAAVFGAADVLRHDGEN